MQFLKSHEWVRFEGDAAYVGISDYAQKELGDIVFVGLPEVGRRIEAGEVFADLESVKAVSDVYCPVGGVVSEVNGELIDAPERINQSAYDAWIIKIEPVTSSGDLLSEEQYQASLAGEG